MITHPRAIRGPSCFTLAILRELVFPTWYGRNNDSGIPSRLASYFLGLPTSSLSGVDTFDFEVCHMLTRLNKFFFTFSLT